MAKQFIPTMIIIMGPNVPEFVAKPTQGVGLGFMKHDEPTVLLRGKVPFRGDVRFPAKSEELEVTARRLLWTASFTLRGQAVLPTVNAAVQDGDLEEVSRLLNVLLNTYVTDKFMID